MSPDVQSAFNVVKGSVPARMDVPDTGLRHVRQEGHRRREGGQREGQRSSARWRRTMRSRRRSRGAYHDVVTKFFHGEIKTFRRRRDGTRQGDQRRQVSTTDLPRLAAGEGFRTHGSSAQVQEADHDHDRCADRRSRRPQSATRLRGPAAATILPRLVLAPSFLLVLIFVYGFNLWTLLLVLHQFEGLHQLQVHRLRQLPEALELDLRDRPAVELVHGDRQYGPVRRALCRRSVWSSA